MSGPNLDHLEIFCGLREAASALEMDPTNLRRAVSRPESKYAPDCALRRGGKLVPLWSDERIQEIQEEAKK